MSNNYSSTLRRILDKLHSSKWARIIPILTAAVMYILFLLFGGPEQKLFLAIAAPAMSAIWYAGVYFILYFQVKNPMCSSKALDLFMLIPTLLFGLSAVSLLITFLSDLQYGFTIGLMLTLVTWSAISLVFSKRGEK